MNKHEEQEKLKRMYQGKVNKAQGKFFEDLIEAGCIHYSNKGYAEIKKTPEPFRVLRMNPDGTFVGRFTAKAEPDFKGILADGTSIVFEAKYTAADRMNRSVVTENQMTLLEKYHQMGALSAVFICIGDEYFFIPWIIWREMKLFFGRQYVARADVSSFSVKFNGAVLFLNYISPSAAYEYEKELMDKVKKRIEEGLR